MEAGFSGLYGTLGIFCLSWNPEHRDLKLSQRYAKPTLLLSAQFLMHHGPVWLGLRT